jgi:hypothetical protein
MVLGLGRQIMAQYTAAQWAVESVNAFRVLFGAGDGSADSTALRVCPFLNLPFGGWGSSSESVSTLRWSMVMTHQWH